jgi:sec-independent protein translocase protein TatC
MTDGRLMTFWDHLDELRRRLLRSFLAIAVAAIAGFWVSPQIQTFLIEPFKEKVSGSLALLSPADGFVIQMKIAFLFGIVAALPVVAFQLYGFIGPALQRKERRFLWPIVLLSNIMFWGGVIFAWWILPTALEFLGSFAEIGVQNIWSLRSYISLVLFLLLAFGMIFQLPLVIGILIATGLVPSTFFRRHRRYAVVIIFIIAAFATPTTDWLTMTLMAGPLLVLYELSIWVGWWIERRKTKQQISNTASG